MPRAACGLGNGGGGRLLVGGGVGGRTCGWSCAAKKMKRRRLERSQQRGWSWCIDVVLMMIDAAKQFVGGDATDE